MVDILMATYNGEMYVEQQIQSILKQTYTDWRLYIRDDGSKDKTNTILKEYQLKYPEKIVLIEDEEKGLGAKLNFGRLLSYSNSEYCMFCDQDDVWNDAKIEICLNKMKKIESKYSSKMPILVNTNLKVVDNNLETINESFWDYQQIDGVNTEIGKLIVENNVTGCTMFMNKALVNKSIELPEECLMHDWWIALVATAIGKRAVIEDATMLYRQHNMNEVGASDAKSLLFILSKLEKDKINDSINKSIKQANKFYEMYKSELTEKDRECLYKFINIRKHNLLKRKFIAIKNKFYKSSLKRRIGYLLFI